MTGGWGGGRKGAGQGEAGRGGGLSRGIDSSGGASRRSRTKVGSRDGVGRPSGADAAARCAGARCAGVEQACEAGAVVRGDESANKDEHDKVVVGEEEREGGEPPLDAGHDGEDAWEGERVALGVDGGD
jgi:hypothetical protein